MATKGLATGFAAKRPDPLHTEGRRWPPKGQHQVLEPRDQITYFLRADGHKGSAGFVEKRPHHLHSESRDGHTKVHRKFVIKKQSEYDMHIKTGYLQTTMIHSVISAYMSLCGITYFLNNCTMVITCYQQ